MYTPEKGEQLYLYTPCSDYWIAMVRKPYTVAEVKGKTCYVREAMPIFNGPVYYDTLPDRIEDDKYGRVMTLRWSDKKNRWQESPAGSYPRVAVFGKWDYQPYLN